jgi:hypothetical protein
MWGAIIIAFLFCRLSGAAQELLCEGGFEGSTSNGTFPSSGCWQPAWLGEAGGIVTTTSAKTGANGLWVYTGNSASDWWSGIYQEFPATVGTVYRGSAWISSPASEAWPAGSKAVVRICLIRQGGTDIYESTGVTSANSAFAQYQIVTPEAPADVLRVRFVCYVQKPETSGQAIANFDDCSLVATLPPVAITGQPQSQTANAGAAVTLTVTARGMAPLSYQWQKNGANIFGATSSSFTFAKVQTTDAGNYSVTATNSSGTATSNVAVLTVNSPPSITLQPASRSVNAGSSVTFSVSATGGSLLYQWKKNGVDISGATSSSFTIGATQNSNGGTFTVTVSNSAGSITSAVATLSIISNGFPSITNHPTSQGVVVGSSATFSVTATGTTPLSYQWRKGDTNLGGATNSSVTIPSVRTSDAGGYTVLINNGSGSVTSEVAVLSINVRPEILAAPVSPTRNVGEDVVFSVTATGVPAPSYQWRKNGSAIGSATNTSLTLRSIISADAGAYDVVVSNPAGSITSTAATLTIIAGAPLITAEPQDQIASPGAGITFTVQASSATPLSYQWKFNGADVPGETNATLQLPNVTASQAGTFRVVVGNSLGTQNSRDAILTVVVPRTARQSAALSIEHLRRVMDEFHDRIPVYDDIGSPGNRFHARGQIPDETALVTIYGSWTDSPRSGATCIRCSFTRDGDNHGGFYFLNGILLGPDAPPPLLRNAPAPYFGEAIVPGTNIAVTNRSGLNLQGATALTFWARGTMGNEVIEFFIGGVGRDAESGVKTQPFPDSTPRVPARGKTTQLTTSWQKFTIDLTGVDLSNIMGGFGWTANASNNPNGAVFFLDDIQFELLPDRLEARLNEPRFLRSFLTKPVQPDITNADIDDDLDVVFRNLAFIYDNAIALGAFLAEGSPDSVRRAKLIGDAMVDAANKDRFYKDGRLRTAYMAGDIALPPGWEPNGKKATVPVPGFYAEDDKTFYEVENQHIDTGNNTWAMLALISLYERAGEDKYLEAAQKIGRFILTLRDNAGKYQGFRGGIWDAEASPRPRAYASTEHNLDIFAAFTRTAQITGRAEWSEGADHARKFVESMWDPLLGLYRTGTNEDNPDTRNESSGQLPLDVQSWNVLARPNVPGLRPHLLSRVEVEHSAIDGGLTGFDFNEDRDGVWLEGTAQMAVAYKIAQQSASAEPLLASLRAAQQFPAPIGDGLGTVAASHDGVSSGFGFKWFRRLHVSATGWNVFAQLGVNPFYDIGRPCRLANLSVLTTLGGSGDNFTMGYVVGGDGTTGPKSLLFRAAGPALTGLGITGFLEDPKIELFAGATRTGENDNWAGFPALGSAMSAVGAFPFPDANSKDAAALVATTVGSNSATVSGTGRGTVLAEIYDTAPSGSFTNATLRLLNVSVLRNLGSGITVGFVVAGSGSKNFLIRAIGPTLSTLFGVGGAIIDPQLELYRGPTKIAENNDWAGTTSLADAFAQVGAFSLAATSRDAALVASLQPGNYTVRVTGVGNMTGIVLVEVYEAP